MSEAEHAASDGAVAMEEAKPDELPAWTRIGTLDGVAEPVVDARGAVSVAPGAPVVDWMVAGDDRWYDPRHETTVRQSLRAGAPVVETLMRVKGGEVRHRAYAITRSSADGGGDAVVIEFENATSVPCALGLLVRPHDLEDPVPITDIALEGGCLRLDGTVRLVLPRSPGAAISGSLGEGDLSTRLVAGEATDARLTRTHFDGRDAQVATVVPVPHGTTVRAVIPIVDRGSEAPDAGVRFPSALPSAQQVASGWSTLIQDRARTVVPDPRLAAVLDAALPALLAASHDVLADGGRTARGGRREARWDHVAVCAEALDRFGCATESALLLAHAAAAFLVSNAPARRASGADVGPAWLITAFAEHIRVGGDPAFANAVSDATTRILSSLAPFDSDRSIPASAGPFPGPLSEVFADAAIVFEAAGEARAGRAARRAAARRADAEREAPAGGRAALVGFETDVVARAGRARRAVRDGASASAWRTLDVLLDVVSPTGAWPSALELDPAAAPSERHSIAAGAAVACLALDVLAGADNTGVHLLRSVPESWLGQRIEAHGVCTTRGVVSFAVRWHGDRPALLWEIETECGAGRPCAVDACGLDAAWRGDGCTGEALLAPVELPERATRGGAVISGLQIGSRPRKTGAADAPEES